MLEANKLLRSYGLELRVEGGGVAVSQQPAPDEEVFPASVSIIAPICVVCLLLSSSTVSWRQVLPYLAGSCIGGVATGLVGDRIPTVWLHRILGAFILWGGFRYLC